MGCGGSCRGGVGLGWCDHRCYSYLSQMQNDANCCDMSLYEVLFGVGWGRVEWGGVV